MGTGREFDSRLFDYCIAGLDRHANFYAIAKTMPIATAVICFLSTQNTGS
jgi:hypothetical protein